eukprot:12904440-Prorocentrum_lima.AAC.1
MFSRVRGRGNTRMPILMPTSNGIFNTNRRRSCMQCMGNVDCAELPPFFVSHSNGSCKKHLFFELVALDAIALV